MRLFETKRSLSKLEQLYDSKDLKIKARELARAKARVFYLSITITTLLIIILGVTRKEEYISTLLRGGHGEGNKNVTLTAEFNKDKTETISVSVKEKRYNEYELQVYSKKIAEKLPVIIKGNNPSLDEVSTNLNLVKKVEDYPFTITWKVDKPLIVSTEGVIDKARLSKELDKLGERDVLIGLCATLKYDEYSEDIYLFVNVVKSKNKSYEDFIFDLNESIKESDYNSRFQDNQMLPDKVDGVMVRYKKENGNEIVVVGIIGVICAIGLVIGKDKELDKQIKKRNDELNNDYSKILNQYVLYYSAGMNHRMIWNEICNRYEERIKIGEEKRIAFEEMLITNRNLNDGVGEIAAYEAFAKRCHLAKYRAFINIVEQSIQKGRDGLNIVLEEEVEKSQREESNRVRMKVQEMSTKLLFPMLLMLVIVLVIVMVPAFISFNN